MPYLTPLELPEKLQKFTVKRLSCQVPCRAILKSYLRSGLRTAISQVHNSAPGGFQGASSASVRCQCWLASWRSCLGIRAACKAPGSAAHTRAAMRVGRSSIF